MPASQLNDRRCVETFLAELTDAALAITRRHKPQSPSIEIELDLWNSLRNAFGQHARRVRSRRDAVALLAEAAFRAALRHRPTGPTIELELRLWRAFRKIAYRPGFTDLLSRRVRASCLTSAVCSGFVIE